MKRGSAAINKKRELNRTSGHRARKGLVFDSTIMPDHASMVPFLLIGIVALMQWRARKWCGTLAYNFSFSVLSLPPWLPDKKQHGNCMYRRERDMADEAARLDSQFFKARCRFLKLAIDAYVKRFSPTNPMAREAGAFESHGVHEMHDIDPGTVCWYFKMAQPAGVDDSGYWQGCWSLAMVHSLDRTLSPPSYSILTMGQSGSSIKDTERDRLKILSGHFPRWLHDGYGIACMHCGPERDFFEEEFGDM